MACHPGRLEQACNAVAHDGRIHSGNRHHGSGPSNQEGQLVNIGLFSDSFSPEISGVVSSIETLREALEKRGHHVYVFTTSRPDAPVTPGVFRLPSMPLLFLKSHRFAIFYTPRAARSVRRVKLDVIHTQTEFSLGLFGKLMALTLGIPGVHTYHTLYKDYTHYVTKGHFMKVSQEMVRLLTRTFCNDCRLVIAPTDKVATLLREYGVRRPIRVIPSGLKLERFTAVAHDPAVRARMRETLGIPHDTPLLVYIGRLAKEKSIDMLIHALSLVRVKMPAARLLIVGDGPDRALLTQQARQAGLGDAVLFAGSRPWQDIPSCYCVGDVFVSASTTETQGLTVIEAMAAGVPVVARDDPSFRAMVSHGTSGFLFNTVEELAQHALAILQSPQTADALRAGADQAVRRFSAEAFGESAEAAYLEAMAMPETQLAVRAFKVVGHAGTLTGKLKTRLTHTLRTRFGEHTRDRSPRFHRFRLDDVIRPRRRK
jgi:1,2-diacylglycerol 3-alpha-glucosyltransferase